MDQVSLDRVELYICCPPARLWVPILVHTSEVNDYIPEEAKIYIEVLGLKYGRAGGPSVMRTKELTGWKQEAKREKDPEGRRWEPVVILVQAMFRYGTELE